ncbi:SCO1860 family LAETG-anchored protein [Streptomyces sp. ISL-100]|uniref:SCO1860 family LAETG-anchored protein n=1 Tax=Streptomyces sp. ISL-100 TaxID=2819173 RepID=UPI0020354F32|nr:SCO1860 family LAETG-anchored protein [Streptomyces sp. ISL-100]
MPARRPARRSAAAAAAFALTAGPAAALLVAAPAAHATGGGGEGRADAVVLRTGLDISLLNKSVNVPLTAALNEVNAPASAEKTALTVQLDGVEQGKPVSVLRADVATAKATADAHKTEGHVNLAHARVHVPGLPLLSLIEVEKVTSKALCEAGKQPVAESNVLGAVTVLGKKVTLSAGGPTRVDVPAVGVVTLDLSKTHTTSRTAAATALELKVSVNPLKLNVAEVDGTVTLAGATCESPKAPPAKEEPKAPSAPAPEPDVKPQTATATEANLAETGGSSTTPYLAGGAALLLASGAAALAVARSRRSRNGA